MSNPRRRYSNIMVSMDGHKFHVTPDRTVYYFNKGRGLRKVTNPDIKSAVFMKLYADHGEPDKEE